MIGVAEIRNAKVLIVDDKEDNIRLLERTLLAEGYVSIEATSESREVCALHARNRYDLILLDLVMPDFDGFEVMEALKSVEVDSYLPVLVITAEPGHKLRALKAGAKDFVSKPLDLAEVCMRIHNMIEVRLLHMESRTLYQQLLHERDVQVELESALQDALTKNVHSADEPLGIVARSAAMRRILDLGRRVAKVDSTVLITGESGSGK
jgi:adenylate cyclase